MRSFARGTKAALLPDGVDMFRSIETYLTLFPQAGRFFTTGYFCYPAIGCDLTFRYFLYDREDFIDLSISQYRIHMTDYL